MPDALFESETIVILDFETTGLSAINDRVIEVAALRYRNGRLDETFTTLIDPGFRPSPRIVEITGIDGGMLRGAPAPEYVFPRLVRFLEGHPVLAHNASFDQKFFQAEIRRAGIRWPGDSFNCTLKLSRKAWPGLSSYRLGDLARELKLPIEGNLHRAEADARLTGHLWSRIVERLAPDRTPSPSRPTRTPDQTPAPESKRPKAPPESNAEASYKAAEPPAGEVRQRLPVTLEIAEFGGELPVQIHARRLMVKVPAGVREGQIIRLRGVTHDGSDALLEVTYEPHRLFRLEGRDVFFTLRIPPRSAALGTTLVVPTLSGDVAMKVPPNSETGMRFRLKGRGRAGEPIGDQIVILEVSAPPAENDAQRAAYAEKALIIESARFVDSSCSERQSVSIGEIKKQSFDDIPGAGSGHAIIRCESCDGDISVPVGRLLNVKCGHCSHQFFYDSYVHLKGVKGGNNDHNKTAGWTVVPEVGQRNYHGLMLYRCKSCGQVTEQDDSHIGTCGYCKRTGFV